MSSRSQMAAATVIAAPLLLLPPLAAEVSAAGVTHSQVRKAKTKRVRLHKKPKRKKAPKHYRATTDSCVMLSPEDRDLITRTVMGEANGEGFTGKVAVAAVIKNRLLDGGYGGDTVPGVLFKPKQFEPWGTRKRELMGYSPSDPRYQEASEAVDAAFSGNDPTDGATHFANVGTVKDRGNDTALGWLRSMSNVSRIGQHTFGNADGKGDGRAVRDIDGGPRSVLGSMSGRDPEDDLLLELGEDDPFDFDAELSELDTPTDDPRRLAVRSLISEILEGLDAPDGQGHAVAPGDGAANEDEEA